MTLLPTQWAEAMREAQAALYGLCQKVDERMPESVRAYQAAEKLTAALSDQGAKDTANALGVVRLAAEQAYRDLVAVSVCVTAKLDTLEAMPNELLGEHVRTIRHGLEHVRNAATLILKALADDVRGPGREIADNHRYLRNLLAGLLAKDRGDFSLREAGQELGQLHHQMRERIRMAERASIYLAWLEWLAYRAIDSNPLAHNHWKTQATLYAQAARGFVEGRHPKADVLDHPLMRNPAQGTLASAETSGKGE